MSFGHNKEWILSLSVGVVLGVTLSAVFFRKASKVDNDRPAVVDGFSIADQPKRFAKAKQDHNRRVLDIDSFYNPSFLNDKVVLITGVFDNANSRSQFSNV